MVTNLIYGGTLNNQCAVKETGNQRVNKKDKKNK
jgi:hypothetical protein